MKRLILVAILTVSILSAVFGISDFEKSLLPEFKGDLNTVNYRVVENSGTDVVIEINGVLYVLKK